MYLWDCVTGEPWACVLHSLWAEPCARTSYRVNSLRDTHHSEPGCGECW